MTRSIDYGQPLIFFGILTFFSIAGYHVEKVFGIGAFVIFVLWALLTGYVFSLINKKRLEYNHPANFFAWFFTFSIAGYYIDKMLNPETFIVVILWVVIAQLTLKWFKRNIREDKRLFYLICLVFIALAFLVPVLLDFTNSDLNALFHNADHHFTEGAVSAEELSHILLETLNKLIVFASIAMSFYALRMGLKNAKKKARVKKVKVKKNNH